jgi:hypothetical protein
MGAARALRSVGGLSVTHKRGEALRQASGSFRSSDSSLINPISEAPGGPVHARVRPARQAHSRAYEVMKSVGHTTRDSFAVNSPTVARAGASDWYRCAGCSECAGKAGGDVRNGDRIMPGLLRPLRHERHRAGTRRSLDSCVRCVMSIMRAAKVVLEACVPRTIGDLVGFARPVFSTDNGLRTTDCEARILASAAS